MTQPDPDLRPSLEFDRIVWTDYEAMGLEPEHHVIIETVALVIGTSFNVLGEGVGVVVHASETESVQTDDFVAKIHVKSGLDQETRAGKTSITDTEQAVLDYIRRWVSEPRTTPLAGNSIAFDRKLIHHYMPESDQHLHYRMADVSSFKELVHRWYP